MLKKNVSYQNCCKIKVPIKKKSVRFIQSSVQCQCHMISFTSIAD